MNNRIRKLLIGIIFVAVLLRVIVALLLGDRVVELPGIADQISYHTLALRVLNGYGFSFDSAWWPATAAGAPTAHWSFLYTFYLVGVYALFGSHPLVGRLIQVTIIGILQPLLTYLLTQRVFSRYTPSAHWIGLLAAGLNAIYTYFIYYSAALMTEPFFITAVLASLYLAILLGENLSGQFEASRSSNGIYGFALGLGLCLSIAILLRQLVLVTIPFLLLWVWWNTRKRILIILIPVVVLVASILPFSIYNYSRFHRFVLLNTNAGFVMYWANHPVYGTHFVPILPTGEYYNLIPPELRSLDEAALDQALLHEGIRYITHDPGRYLLLSLSRIPVYFEFWPSREDNLFSNISRVFGFGLYLPFMVYGLFHAGTILYQHTKPRTKILASPLFLLFLFIVIYTAIHLLAWALIRYRLPVDAVLITFGGLTVYDLFNWLLRKSRQINLKKLSVRSRESARN